MVADASVVYEVRIFTGKQSPLLQEKHCPACVIARLPSSAFGGWREVDAS